MDINGWQLPAQRFMSDAPSQRKSGTLWNYRPLCTGHLSIFSKWDCKPQEKKKGWVGGEKEHSLARNLLNSEGQGPEALCRGGEGYSLACPRHINHHREDIPKANYVECFLGKSSPSRPCKSSPALAGIQLRLGVGWGWVGCQCTPVSGGGITPGAPVLTSTWCVRSCYLHPGEQCRAQLFVVP